MHKPQVIGVQVDECAPKQHHEQDGSNDACRDSSDGFPYGVLYPSRVLEGFWLQVEWLWTRPPLWETLKRLGLA
jgi:hypothetical protein